MLTRMDHYAREATSSAEYALIHAPTFNWEDDNFLLQTETSWRSMSCILALVMMKILSGCDI